MTSETDERDGPPDSSAPQGAENVRRGPVEAAHVAREEARGGASDLRPDDDVPESVRRRLEQFVPELVRRTFSAGLGAVFSTEEGIRKLAREMSLPKDVASYLVSTAASTKDDVLRIMARETRDFLQTVNLAEEVARMLSNISLEVKTEIRFLPNEKKSGGIEPGVTSKVSLKRSSGKDGDSPDPPKRRRRITLRRSGSDD